MTHSFDKDYWERHWEQAHDAAPEDAESSAPNPHLIRAASGLEPSRVRRRSPARSSEPAVELSGLHDDVVQATRHP